VKKSPTNVEQATKKKPTETTPPEGKYQDTAVPPQSSKGK
jgi:hypothetical protein